MALVFNRANDNYLFHGSEFKAGSSLSGLRLSSSNRQARIDICNNGDVDVSGNIAVAGTLDVTGDTSVFTFDSSGATSLATGGGVVNIATTGVMTTVKGTLNVEEAVTLDGTLDVTGDTSVFTFDPMMQY